MLAERRTSEANKSISREEEEAAALIIQKNFRGYIARKIYKTLKATHGKGGLSQNVKGNIGPGAYKRLTFALDAKTTTFNCFVDESEIVKNSIV